MNQIIVNGIDVNEVVAERDRLAALADSRGRIIKNNEEKIERLKNDVEQLRAELRKKEVLIEDQAETCANVSRLAAVTGALEDALHKRTDALRRIRALPCTCAATFKDGSHLTDCVRRSVAVSIAREVLGGEP